MYEQRVSRVDIVFGWSLKINKIHVHEIDTKKAYNQAWCKERMKRNWQQVMQKEMNLYSQCCALTAATTSFERSTDRVQSSILQV